MGNYEDVYWDITERVRALGLEKELQSELARLVNQPNRKHLPYRDNIECAFNAVMNQYNWNQLIRISDYCS